MKDKRRSLQRPVHTRPAVPATRPVNVVNRRPSPVDQALRDARTQAAPTRERTREHDRDDETDDPYVARPDDDDERDQDEEPDDEEESDDDEEFVADDDYMEEAEDEDDAAEDDAEEYTAASYLATQRLLLPSGKAIRLRSYSLFSAMDRGELPNTLIKIAREQLYGKGNAQQPRDRQRAKTAQTEDLEISALMDWLCCKMIASFHCVDKPQAKCQRGEVSVSALYDADKVAILQFALQGQQALRSFRR